MSIRLNGKIIAGNSKSTYTGFEIGDIGISSLGIDENQNRRRYLNGQTIISEQFVAFTEKLKSASTLHPTLICTEEEWQTTSSLSVGGQCGKFVIDDEAGTIRLPKIIMPIQGLTDLSKLAEIVEAGLPNITGSFYAKNANYDPTDNIFDGAFDVAKTGISYKSASGESADGTSKYNFDASLSNTIYNNSDTVQQEQIQYPYFIQVATGTETEDNVINTLELNNPFVLLESKYFESEIYNVSWLLANGSYNGSNAVHPSAYQALLVENNTEVAIGSTVTLSIGTEYTKRGLSVKLSTDNDITDYDFVVNTSDEIFRLPIKVNLASGKAVVGNGNSLGLTAGLEERNYGLISLSREGANILGAWSNASGLPAGTAAPSTGTSPDADKAIGVTTDPTKSGIETSDASLYLYFYVGETVQNANLINAGRIEEKVASLIPDNSSLIVNYGLPSDEYIDLTIGASGSTYTMPENGYLTIIHVPQNDFDGGQSFTMNNETLGNFGVTGFNIWGRATYGILPVRKNDVINISYANSVTSLRLYKLKGEV